MPSRRTFSRILAALAAAIALPAAAQLTPSPQVAFGAYHGCALSTAGAVSCWGENLEGQLGDGSSVEKRSVPKLVPALASGVAAIAAGRLHTCALTTGGAVRCWGNNARGQLGDSSFTGRTTPVAASGLSGVTAISAGGDQTCAIVSGGQLRCWGDNNFGQLGIGDGSFGVNRSTSAPVTGFGSGTRGVSVGGHHVCAIKPDATVHCWGENYAQQLGTPGTTRPVDIPMPVALPAGATQVSLGWELSCALLNTGGVMCWGFNDHGQLGNGVISPPGPRATGPVDVLGLTSGVAYISAGYYHVCALSVSRIIFCWGSNSYQERGMLGDGTSRDRPTAQPVAGVPEGVIFVEGGAGNSAAVAVDGSVLAWGTNRTGTVADGTFVDRFTPRLAAGLDGVGYLDLTPGDGQTVPAALGVPFEVVTSSTNSGSVVATNVKVPPGATSNVYLFALAPADIVRGVATDGDFPITTKARSADGKETAVSCVLAQLTSSGQLQAVSASSLQAYVTGVASGQTAAVTVINGTSTAQIGGATFYVGVGTTASTMLNGGSNRSVSTVGGARECKPQAPQAGWWWKTTEGGRGYSIEAAGNRIFFAAFLYDASGRATWSVATGKTSLDGSVFTGPLYQLADGQSLGGAYRAPVFTNVTDTVTLTFSEATRGVMVWPGGVVDIERFNIVPNGLTLPVGANSPESGWWWNPDESGRGFFLEFQGNTVDLAGYMYDDAGNPIWYLTVFPATDLREINTSWWQFGGGQTMTGTYRPATLLTQSLAPVTVRFSSPTEAVITLPNGRSSRIVRHRF